MKIVGLGAGGHARVLLDLIDRLPSARPEVVGLLDPDRARHGAMLAGRPILGGDDLLPALRRDGVEGCFIGLGSVGKLGGRRRLFELALALGFEPVTLVHPSAIVAASAVLGRGSCVMAGAIVNADARLGANVCVNTGAIIEHDCELGDHAFVGPGAVLAGGVVAGAEAFIGLRAAIRQGLKVGPGAVVGGGAMVVRDVPAGTTVVGMPAKPRG